MSFPLDAVNGLFEIGGACLTALSVQQLLRDRQVRGVHPAPTVFFTSWGLWNCIYYPALDQWVSFCGGVALVCVNAVWLSLLIKFRRN
jgi:hypothetical protein